MKILFGDESDHVVKNRQTFLLDLYLNLPGNHDLWSKCIAVRACMENLGWFFVFVNLAERHRAPFNLFSLLNIRARALRENML